MRRLRAVALGLGAIVGLTALDAPAQTTFDPPPGSTSFVTSFTPTVLRNDFSGWVGMKLTIASDPVTVTAVGRWVVPGSSGTHAVKLVDAATRVDVAGGSAAVATAGAPGDAFAYAALPAPVTLAAGATYYLVSQEVAGGDQWYNYDTQTQTTAVGVDVGSVWSWDGATYVDNAVAGNAFGVPTFAYTVAATAPAVTLHPQDRSVPEGTAATFSAAASGSPAPTVQWEARPPAGSFAAVPGATATTLEVPAVTAAHDGTQYRAVFTNASGTATTDPATLTVLPATSFVTSFTPAALRNDFSGWVGLKATIGPSPLTVTAVGRWVVPGNSGIHTVKLVDAATGTDVPGATATVATAGAPPDAFALAALAAPVTLNAGATYYLLSEEVAGGDQWYDFDTHTQTTPGADMGSVWSWDGVSYVHNSVAGNAFGVPTFLYQPVAPPPPPAAGTSLVTGFLPTALRNDFDGWVGMRVTVGAKDMTVLALGRWVLSGNTQAHAVKLVDAATGADVPGATAIVATNGIRAGTFAYASLPAPVVLPAGTTYHLVSQEFAGGDWWYDSNTNTQTTPDATDAGAVWSLDGISYVANTVVGQAFGIPNVAYTLNRPPVAVDDGGFTRLEDDAALVAPSGAVLANDSDPDSAGPLTAQLGTGAGNAASFTFGTDGGFTYTPNPDFCGPDTFTYRAVDPLGATSNLATVTIDVACVNDEPSFTAGADQTVLEDAGAQTVPGWATAITAGPANEAGQTLGFEIANDNNALFSVQPAVAADGTLTYTSAANASGMANVKLKAFDDGGTALGGVNVSPEQTFTITVMAVNDEPGFTAGANQTVLEDAGALQTVPGWATGISAGAPNEAGQTLTFTVTNDNNALFSVQPAVDPVGGDLSFTPAADANGLATVTVTLADDGGTANGGDDTSPAQVFTITVTGVNDEPGFTAGADQTVLEDAGAQTVNGWATGISAGAPNEAGQALTFAATNDSSVLFSVQPAVDPVGGNLTFTPAADANGLATVTVTLADDGGTANGGDDTSPAQVFTITVTGVNDAPSFTAGADQTVLEDAGAQTVNGWATAISRGPADEAGQVLTFTATNGNNPLFSVQPAVDPVTGNLTYTPAGDANGAATVTVVLQDNGGVVNGGDDTSDGQPFAITVTAVNDPPVNTLPGPQTVIAGQNLAFTGATAITVADVDAGSSPIEVTVTVSNGTFSLAGTGGLTFSVGDGTSDATMTFTGTLADVNAALDSSAVTAGSVGPATVTVTSDDQGNTGAGGALSDTDTVDITVVPPNMAPTDIALSNATVDENQPSGTAVGTFTTSDPDAGDTHTYSLVSGTGDAGNGSFRIVGDALETAGVFDFEAKSSYSIRVRTTDSGDGNLTYEEQLTISVDDLNDAPTDIALSNATVDENQPSGTAVGTFTTADQDTVDTHTYTLVAGTGDADNGSFTIAGTTLQAAATFNFEAKNSYSIRVRTTDSGSPSLSFDEAITISVNDVNDAPTAVADSYSGAVGNTLFVLNSGGTGPKVTVTGSVVTANDTDEDATFPHTLSVVAETVASAGGGSAAIDSAGNFTFQPGVGDKNQTDTFSYQVTDGSLTSSGTVSVAIVDDLVWYVDNALGSNGNGTSSSPFNTLAGLNGAGGAGDADAASDHLFLYQGSGNYTGGLPLEAGQRLIGQPEGLVVGSATIVAGSGTNPTVTNGGGTGITLANDVTVRRVSVSGTSGAGISGTSITNADIGGNLSVTSSTGAGFSLSGGSGNVSFGGSITHASSGARSVSIANRQGGTVTLSGAIDDTAGGISLATNSGATISFTGGVTVSSGANAGFFATGGGTVSVTGSANMLATTTAAALNVDGASIGPGGLTFRRIDSDGGVTGIVLSGTGSNGGLTVAGAGTPGSGGTIQNKSGNGISLTNVGAPVSLTNMVTTNVAGTDVLVSGGSANLTYAGTITNQAGKGRSIDVSGKGGGTVLFSGLVDDDGQGISLTSNGGTTINFTGGVDLSTGASAAFTATGGGTVNVTGSANVIATTTGTALNVASTNIGANGLTFRSIAAGTGASGPTNAIVLNNTGSTAGLTVNGTGTTDGSGGHIARTTGDGIVLTSTRFVTLRNMIVGDSAATAGQAPDAVNHIGGDGISMTNADDITLDNVKIARTASHGLDGTGVTNLSMQDSEILNAGDGNEEHAFAFNDFAALTENNLDGTVTVTNSVLDGFAEDGIDVENFAGTLNLTVTGSTFANNANTFCSGSSCGENGLLVRSDGNSVTHLTINGGSLFDGIDGNGVFMVSEGSSATASTFNLTNTTIQNSDAFGLVLFGGTGDHTSTIQSRLTFNITSSAGSPVSITGSNSTGMTIQPNGKSIMRGTVSGVTIDGSAIGRGLEVLSDDVSTAIISITGNTIRNTAFNGIFANNGDSGVLDIHIRNNNVSAPLDLAPPSGLAVHGIEVNPTPEASTTCLDIADNVSAGNAASGGAGYRTRQRDPAVFKLERLDPADATNASAVATFLTNQNTSGTGSATVASGYTAVADGTCLDP